MARELVVRLIGDASSLNKTYREAATNTKKFQSEMTGVTGVVTRGGGALQGYGKHLAALAGGYIGITSIKDALETSVSAAVDAQKAQRSLAAQMKAVGDSFGANRAEIEHASLSLEKYGFTVEDSQHALTVLERGTGNITKAISLQGVAANLAKAKNLDLASAANVLAKVFGGQETALRRAVPGLEKTAHGMDLIREAAQKLQGQARANTTEFDRFHATLHNTEVIIGTALLPKLNTMLGRFDKWLDKENRSGDLGKKMNTVVKDTAAAFDLLAAAIKGAKDAYDTFESGTHKAQHALGPFGFLLKGLPSLSYKFGESLFNVADYLGLVDTKAGAAASSFDNLMASLKRAGGAAKKALSAITPQEAGGPRLDIPGGAYGNLNAALTAAQQRAIGLAGDPNNLRLLRQQARADQAALDFAKKLRSSGRISNQKYVEEVTAYASDLQQRNSTISGILSAARQKVADAAKAAADKQKQAADAAKARLAQARQDAIASAQLAVARAQATPGYQDDLAAQQRLVQILQKQLAADKQNVDLQQQLFDAEQAVQATLKARADQASQAKIDAGNLAIQRAQLTDSLADDLAATQKQVGILKAQHASEQDIVQAQLAVKNIRDQIAQNRQQAAQAAAQARQQAADRARQAAQAAAEAAARRRDAVQFRLLGLGPTGGALIPGIANLRTRLGGIRDAVKGTFLDTTKTRAELDHIAKILSGAFGSVSEQVRSAIDQMYKDIRDKLKSQQGNQTKFAHLSSQKFVDSLGLNLTRAQRRVIEAQFSTVGAGGTVPGAHSTQFGAGITIHGGVHVHGVQDVAALENQLVKRAKARAHTRRGA
jgi:hypothetical protein